MCVPYWLEWREYLGRYVSISFVRIPRRSHVHAILTLYHSHKAKK
jgi:hypothetical protein